MDKGQQNFIDGIATWFLMLHDYGIDEEKTKELFHAEIDHVIEQVKEKIEV